MPELDKWQQREVQRYARENDVTEEAALKVLFPDEVVPADEPGDAEGADVKASASARAKATK
jgi:hypothetical protein